VAGESAALTGIRSLSRAEITETIRSPLPRALALFIHHHADNVAVGCDRDVGDPSGRNPTGFMLVIPMEAGNPCTVLYHVRAAALAASAKLPTRGSCASSLTTGGLAF